MKVPETAEAAARVLGTIPTPESQELLADLASRVALPLKVRQAAAEAFAASVKRFGVQLTTARIQNQYDRYNASERLDKPTQAVLGSILDAIETRGRPKKRRNSVFPPALVVCP